MPNDEHEQLNVGVANIGNANTDQLLTRPESAAQESNCLTDEEYLDLYKYFQEKADSVKEAMFRTLTWTIGFAAALLALIFTNLAKFETGHAAVPLVWLVIVFAFAGVIISGYSLRMLAEAGEHIRSNWDRADRSKDKVKGLSWVVDGEKKPIGILSKLRKFFRRGSTPRIVRRLEGIVDLFLGAFLVVLSLAVLAMFDCNLLCDHLGCTSDYHKRVCPYTEWKMPEKATQRKLTQPGGTT